MVDQGGVSVWRVEGPALVAAYATPAVLGLKAAMSWGAWVSSPAVVAARSAGLWTGLALGSALLFWCTILKVRLEVGPGGIVAVNPWGTQRLSLEEVAFVRLGAWGAEFHDGDGFKTTAYALTGMAGGTSQDRRFAELLEALEGEPDSSQR
ncbi:hypothetical protein ACGFR6_20140 [Streptomyces sp. NPDC048567]|uniref:hypothetical protein n=1 Tax=Streptomyces sp. NPDC048567 TaxID=3365570 RepID=UPI0037141149